jgi:hypothetical protein
LKFEVQVRSDLPPLAWLLRYQKAAKTAEVLAGCAVDFGDDFFFEGGWAAEFDGKEFLDSPCFGSGARIDGGSIVFTGPDHSLDRLFLHRDAKESLVSNSLPLILAEADKHLLMDRCDYLSVQGEIRYGLSRFKSQFAISGGSALEVWSWHQMQLAPDLAVTYHEMNRKVAIPDFQSYRAFLSEMIGKVFANCSDPGRKRKFVPIATISSGYDSLTIAALATEHGCREGFTFSKSRSALGRPEEDDSGRDAANALGIKLHEVDRFRYREQSDLPELKTCGVASEMSAAQELLEGRVLLTGFMGDTMWDREPATVSSDVSWPLIAGHNLTELRLSSPFVHFCVPFLACRQQTDVIRVSQSAEMAPWRLNNEYDRPICRRVCEEKGVPRGAFGNKKRAAGVFYREEGLRNTMAPESYLDYSRFREQYTRFSLLRSRLADRLYRIVGLYNAVVTKASGISDRLIGLSLRFLRVRNEPGLVSEGALLYQWAAERMAADYRRRE